MTEEEAREETGRDGRNRVVESLEWQGIAA